MVSNDQRVRILSRTDCHPRVIYKQLIHLLFSLVNLLSPSYPIKIELLSASRISFITRKWYTGRVTTTSSVSLCLSVVCKNTLSREVSDTLQLIMILIISETFDLIILPSKFFYHWKSRISFILSPLCPCPQSVSYFIVWIEMYTISIGDFITHVNIR